MNSSSKVGFVGTGAMGGGLAASLCRQGYRVAFFARSENSERISQLAAAGAERAETLNALGRHCEIVVLCLPDSPAVESVLSEEAGLVPALPPGSIIVDCSTSHPDSTRRLAASLAIRHITLLDGPLTGSRAQADTGTVNILAAGPRAAFDVVRPVLEDLSARIFYLGESGAGHAAKLLNNFFGQLALAGLCETWMLLSAYEVDPSAFYDAISASGGNSATFQAVYGRLCERDFSLSFAQRLAGKDVRYLVEAAQSVNLPSPLASALLDIHQRATTAGFGDQDVKALLLFYEQARSKLSEGCAPTMP